MNTAVYFSSESGIHANIPFILQTVETRLLKLDKRPRCGTHTRYTIEILPSTPGSRPRPRRPPSAGAPGAVRPREVPERPGPDPSVLQRPGAGRGLRRAGLGAPRPVSGGLEPAELPRPGRPSRSRVPRAPAPPFLPASLPSRGPKVPPSALARGPSKPLA